METINKKDKRKQLLIIPLLIIPFLALAFYALGGGKSQDADLQKGHREINADLPDAAFKKEEPTDKMGFYKQSEIDSSYLMADSSLEAINTRLTGSRNEQDIRTDAINQKLEALKQELTRPDEPIRNPTSNHTSTIKETSIKNDVDRLEALMKTMQSEKEEDPEMAQLSGMMDKIIAIQNPELARQKFQQTVSLDSQFKATPAIIVDNQKAVQGATVKIRLQDTLRIAGILVPKGHELFGACKITNQRLLLDIKNIRLGTSIIPVDLSIYSLDGMIGIYAPEAMLTGALNNGTDDAVRSVGFGGFDQTVATQVAGAGIDAARQMISKRVRNVKVKLKSGHAVLLRNNQLRSQY